MKTKIVITCLAALMAMVSCAQHTCPTYSKHTNVKPGAIDIYKSKI